MIIFAMSLLFISSPAIATTAATATAIASTGSYRNLTPSPNGLIFYGAYNWSQPAYWDLTSNAGIPDGAKVTYIYVAWDWNSSITPKTDLHVGLYRNSTNAYYVTSGQVVPEFVGQLAKQKWYSKAAGKTNGWIFPFLSLGWNTAISSGVTTLYQDGTSKTSISADANSEASIPVDTNSETSISTDTNSEDSISPDANAPANSDSTKNANN